MIHLEIVHGSLPVDLDPLRAEARGEGYGFIDRLVDEWTAGTKRFAQPGERLLIARHDGALAGIGGLTREPARADALRMRRFYVRPSQRRLGIGRLLAATLLRARHATVTVNAGTEIAPPFWEALGFTPDPRLGWTHILLPTGTLRATASVLVIGRESPDQPAVAELLRLADERSASLYPAESRHGPTAATLLAAKAQFFVAREADRALGCGGYVTRPDGAAELKRLFVHPTARSKQVGRRLVETLEREAAAERVHTLLLETGVKSHEALGLYRSRGFAERAPFPPYRADKLSVFMSKPLSSDGQRRGLAGTVE